MKVLIIEDERHSYNKLSRMLQRLFPDIVIGGQVRSVEDARQVLSRDDASSYDIIFADIQLDDGLSFEALSDASVDTPVVFTTAYDEYALDAFRNQGLCYLLKPIEEDMLKDAVERARRMKRGTMDIAALSAISTGKTYRQRFLIPGFDGEFLLNAQDISHIELVDEKVMAHLMTGNCVRMPFDSLDEVESVLDPEVFFRVNRRCLVHLQSVKKITNSLRQNKILHLKQYPAERINLSRDKFTKFKDWIEK